MAKSNPNDAVYQYLLRQNRPYSTNDITLNLHKEHGKTAIQKALDLLVADGKICEKLNGKQKAYVINQSVLPTASEEELKALDLQIGRLSAELKAGLDSLKALDFEYKHLLAAPKTDEIFNDIETLTHEIESLEGRLEKLSSNQELVSKDEKVKIETDHELSVKEWRKRKRMCLNITDAILENYPKPKKSLFEEIGIETDEEAGVKMPTM